MVPLLWEELQPLEQLLREFQNDLATGHPEIFYSEVLNDENASVNSAIDLSKVPEYKFQDDDIPAGSLSLSILLMLNHLLMLPQLDILKFTMDIRSAEI
jgi:hypothetical protein